MKVNMKIDNLFGNSNCDFYGFEFWYSGNIEINDEHPRFNDETFSVNEEKYLRT